MVEYPFLNTLSHLMSRALAELELHRFLTGVLSYYDHNTSTYKISTMDDSPSRNTYCSNLVDRSLAEAKKSSLVSGNRPGEFFYHLLAQVVECVSEYIFFALKKQTRKHKAKETKEKREKKESKEEKEKENVVVMNSICGKSNVIRYRLRICSLYF